MSLKRIPREVERKISAGSVFKSFTKAIEELVYNAFDAKSRSIAVRVFIQEGSIQVIDNGVGISSKDFRFLGHRYYTSKLRSDSNSAYYGYRGLSLASIVEVSQKVRITSRHDENSESTYYKTFIEGKEQDVVETSTRPSKGTTVDITGFLWNFHIQKYSINLTNEMSRIKTFLERISLAQCNTSISLRDDSINEIIFQINKHRDITQTLQTLYQIRPQDIQELRVEKNEYKIHGFIEKTVDGDRNYHFIYVNGRFIKNNKLQSSIDKRIKNNNYNGVTNRKHIYENTEKVTTKNSPFYFIFIKCPHQDYDISENDEETLIEFKNWNKIDKLVEKLITFYKGDLRVREISKSEKNNKTTNEDSRKQVRQIMQKILDTNSKKPNRLRLRTGIIGKNATRKDNKKSGKLSISKIVSKQFQTRLNKFYKENPPRNNNNSNNQPLLIESNKETHLEKEEINNEVNRTKNKSNGENNQIKSKCIRPSQESLNKRFKNPTDTILQRCNLLLNGIKECLVPNKSINYTNYASRRAYNTHVIDVRLKNHDMLRKKKGLIKTSHDLIKTINDSESFNLNLFSAKKYKRDTIVKKFGKNSTVKKYSNQKIVSETVEYSKESPLCKRKRFISEKSCSDFHTSKTLRTVLHKIELKKNNNKDKIQKNQEIHTKKTNVAKFLYKNLCTEQSIQGLKTFESHFKNKVKSNFESFGDISYVGHRDHRLINETHSTEAKNYNTRETSNVENVIKYDFHETFTIEISESNNCYGRANEIQWQMTYNNKSDIFSSVILDEVFSRNEELCLNTNIPSLCKTVLQNNTFENSNFKRDLYASMLMTSGNDINLNFKNYQNDGICHYSVHEDSKGVELNHREVTNNIHKDGNLKTYIENQHNTISPLNICEALFQNSPLDNSIFEDNEKASINGKNYFILSHNTNDVFLNEENNCRPLINHVTEFNTSTQETSPYCLEAKLKPTNPNNMFEIELQSGIHDNDVFGEDFNDNIPTKVTKNFYIVDENSELSKQHQRVTPYKKPQFELDSNKDCAIVTNDFKIYSRQSFVPKGMSQITKMQYQKIPYLGKLEDNYYNTNVYDNFAMNLQMFSEVLEPGVQTLNDLDIGIRHVIEPSRNDLIFDDRSLKDAKVIGQVDNKFIGAKVTGRYARVNVISEFLVLFDQHAVDERIQLETNLADYIQGNAWNSLQIDSVPLKLPKDVITYLHNYKDKFTCFGLEWACDDDVVFFKGIPKAIFGKHFRQIDVIMNAVKSLIQEEVEAIKSLKGNVSLYPKSIMDLVFSEACRYAIKFGDVLRKSECENLLSALSKCRLPFQCAHGRPVMAVMMELMTTKYEYKVNVESLKKMKLKLAKKSI